MCNFGGDDTTRARTNQTYDPAGKETFQDVIARGQATSQLPYVPITQGVAGLNPFQQQAMANMSTTSPYMTSAAAHFENAANPLTAANINQYMNPYAANVLANMQEVFGQQQRDETGRLTGAAGGVGADRIAVGKGELARQQGLAAGQTLAGIYQNAAQLAQNQQGVEQASAYGLGNLGNTQFQQYLAQFGVGSAQQATEQAALNAQFNQQMAQQAYPFQTAQWYAGLALPAAGAMGGTTSGTQTVNPPDPNGWSQIAGLGIAALGAFSDPALKEDKSVIGKLNDGTPIYRYRFKGQPQTEIGLMADDVQERHPEAVSGPPGLRRVNYDLATRDAARAMGGRLNGYATGGSPYNASGSMFSGEGSYVPAIPLPTMNAQIGNQPLSYLSPGGADSGGVGGKGSNVQAGRGARSLYDSLFSVGSPEENMGWSTTVSPSGTSGWGNFLSNLMPFKRGGSIEDSEPYKILSSIARGRGGEIEKADGGEVKGYAFGGSPYSYPPSLGGAPILLDEEPKLRNRFPDLEPKKYYSRPAFDALDSAEQFVGPAGGSRLSTPNYGHETIATKAPSINPVTDIPWKSPAKPKGPAGFTIDEPATPVPGLAGTAGAPGGIANDPWVATEPPKEDYSVYTPEGGYQKDPQGSIFHRFAGQSGINGQPLGPGSLAAGASAPPQGDAPFFQEGVDGPVSPNATSRTLAADAGGSPFAGRWSAAFGDVPPYERPKLFGREMSNMNLALMAAGLGMLGGGSPYFGVNVGQGGLKGIEALQEFQKLDADRQSKYLQNMLEAGRLDLGEQQSTFTRYDKMIDNERQLAIYYDGIGDTERANAHQARADELTRQYYGGGGDGSEPVVPGSVPETAEVGAAPETAPAAEYSLPEPPQVDFSHQSKDARAINKAIGLETLKKANEQYDASQSQSMLLAQTRHALMQMPKNGLLTAGPGAQFRNEFARFVNTAYAIGGAQPPIDPTTVGSIEELKKLTTRMGFDLARTLGTREAMQVIQQAVGAVPGAENTPMGARRIMAGIQAGFIRDRDWYEYLDAYAKKNGGDISGAKVAFNKARPTSYYIKMSDEIVAAQTLVADGKMSQEEAIGHLIEQGINPDDVF